MAQHDSTLFNNWGNVVSAIRNEIVFENRNKEYGAYQIRRNYNTTLVVALSITIGTFLFAVSVPKILELLGSLKPVEQERVIDLDDLKMDVPPVDETEPPPPPPPPPPPVQTTVQFTPPVVDEEAPEEDPPPIQETETVISTVTQEGTGDENQIVIPDEGTGTVVEPEVEHVFTIVEQMPEFPGGELEMQKFIVKNIIYPQVERENGISGTVHVSFVVDKDGHINDVKVLRGVNGGPNCDKEAVRVIKSMPQWKGGKQNGRGVPVQINVPIRFVLK